jgi:hypothetical protein
VSSFVRAGVQHECTNHRDADACDQALSPPVYHPMPMTDPADQLRPRKPREEMVFDERWPDG